jgi:hypothetical protein
MSITSVTLLFDIDLYRSIKPRPIVFYSIVIVGASGSVVDLWRALDEKVTDLR